MINQLILPRKASVPTPLTSLRRTLILLDSRLMHLGMALQIRCSRKRLAAAAVSAREFILDKSFGKSTDGVCNGWRHQVSIRTTLACSRRRILIGRTKAGQCVIGEILMLRQAHLVVCAVGAGEMGLDVPVKKEVVRAPDIAPRVQAREFVLTVIETARCD